MSDDKYTLTIEAYDRLAQAYEDKFMDLDSYDPSYVSFCGLVKKQNAAILEIGCGPGNITRYLLKKRPDFKIFAIDAAPNMIALAKKNNPAATFEVMDARKIGNLSQKFDAIISGFCMPYLSKEECEQQIKDCHALLNENGIFYFSVIEDSYSKSGFEDTTDGKGKFHVYYHEENYLRAFLEKNNFDVVEQSRVHFNKADDSTLVTLIFIAKKK
ncbi:MAG: methyltransferase family protein [Bacteroidetes bacterium]|jgi:predicted TPR repeat methyltransferase|nr:methyltransferase family protein [Bacteroidota bacterium]